MPISCRRLPAIPVFLIWLASVAAPVAAQGAAAERPLVFGFLPIVSPERLVDRFQPLVDHIADRLGVPVRMETAPDYAEFVRRTEIERRYDLLFTAPHFYYTAQRRSGYRVVARVDQPQMRALIIVRRDSGIRSLAELRGKTVSTPDALALGTLLIRDRLKAAGLPPRRSVTLVATPTHNASLLSAVKGLTAAAGLMVVPYNRADIGIREQMRVLAETEGVPDMPFSVSSGFGARRAHGFAQALIGLRASPGGRKVLRHLHWPGFVAAVPGDYDVLRRFVNGNSS